MNSNTKFNFECKQSENRLAVHITALERWLFMIWLMQSMMSALGNPAPAIISVSRIRTLKFVSHLLVAQSHTLSSSIVCG